MDENQERIKKNLLSKVNVALRRLDDENFFSEEVELLNIFFNLPFTHNYTTEFLLKGYSFPLIALLGKSGQVYFFAIQRLLTEKEIEDATRS